MKFWYGDNPSINILLALSLVGISYIIVYISKRLRWDEYEISYYLELLNNLYRAI